MSSIVTFLPVDFRSRGNNLAEVIVPYRGGGIRTYDICPRLQTGSGDTILYAEAACSDAWLAAVRDSVTAAINLLSMTVPESHRAQYIADKQLLDLADAQLLMDDALWLTTEMMEEGEPVPDISSRMVVAPNMDARSVIAWLGLVAIDE